MTKALLQYEPEQHIFVERSVRFNPDITWGEKMFLSEVKAMCRKGKCYYQATELAEIFGVAPITIRTWVKNLVNHGFLEVIVDVNETSCKTLLKPTSDQ